MKTSFATLLLLTLIGYATGCGAGQHQSSQPPHERISLSLHASTADKRLTFFEVDRDGQLHFGGGRDAVTHKTHPVGPLTDEQRREIWQLIEKHDLLNGRDRPFARAEQVTYLVQIRKGNQSRSYRAIDDEVPGLKALHDRLFEFQADARYEEADLPGSP